MPRQPRYFVPHIPQHVVQRGVDRQATFFEAADFELYLDVVGEASCQHACQIHAYVLMTNHTHMLITPSTPKSIPLLMQAIGRRYVQTINKRHDRTGTLWEGRYKASLVQSDRYLLTCYRYIELNPVRAGMVRHPGHYRYSSYARNAGGKFDAIVSPHALYQSLGASETSRQAAYRRLFQDEIGVDLLSTIRETTNSCLVLGDDGFKDRIETKLGRSVRPGRPGRPAKRSREG